VLGIISLCIGGYLVAINFTAVEITILYPELSTPGGWRRGLLGVALLVIGIAIFAWLFRGVFMFKRRDSEDFQKGSGSAYAYRQRANDRGTVLLFMLAIIVISILYYLFL
jgi:hypothetical protein